MTTIAYRDGVMAADSQITSPYGLRAGYTTKVFRAPNGTLGGAAGSLGAVTVMREWLEAGAVGVPREMDDVDGLIVFPEGTMYYWDGKRLNVFTGRFGAVGSGEKIAFAAMEMGADARRAIEVAVALDTTSGGPIVVVSHKE